MATVNNYNEVTQLSESMEYPDGYNYVEITGTGDERVEKVFPTIDLTGPSTMDSDGETFGTLTCRIKDTNSDNPFYLETIEGESIEEVSLSKTNYFQTQYWITSLIGVYEDEAKLYQVPASYLEFEENRVHIKDGWRSHDAPSGWDLYGFYHTKCYVEYEPQQTVAVSVGQQTDDKWWEHMGTDEAYDKAEAADTTEKNDDGTSVATGKLYFKEDTGYQCRSGLIPIPNAKGQETSVNFYFLPEEGDSGVAYINAEWASGTDDWPITVGRGDYEGCSLTLTPEPASLKPKEKSIVTFTASDADGAPITGETAYFYIQAGNGNIYPGSATLVRTSNVEEEVTSSTSTTFSLSNPIIKIRSIEVVGSSGFEWNGKATISGTSVTLDTTDDAQDFGSSTMPLKVEYDWGGKCTFEYTANNTKDNDKIYLGAVMGKDSDYNALCSIDIDDGAAEITSPSLTISAEPGTIEQGAESVVTCICYDVDDQGTEDTSDDVSFGVTSGITYTLTPNKGTLTMKADNTAITDEAGSISDSKTISVNYPIKSVSKVTFQGNTLTVSNFEGNTIVVSQDMGVASGTAYVDYVPYGINKGTYTAINEDYTVIVTAKYDSESEGKLMDSCEIVVGEGDPAKGVDGEVGLSLTADPSSLTVGETSTVTATLTNEAGTAMENKTIAFTKEKGTGTLSEASGTTDSSGEATTEVTAKSSGTVVINATYGSLAASTKIVFKAESTGTAAATGDLIALTPVRIVGWADPATKKWELTNGATISDWGEADNCDAFGATDTDMSNAGNDASLVVTNSNNNVFAWHIEDVKITGGTEKLSGTDWNDKDRFYSDIMEVYVPWTWALNSSRTQKITIVDKQDENVPVVGATVKIGGQQATTDVRGTAEFSGLAAGQHDVDILSENYKDNRAGISGGSGVYDSETTNDKYTVPEYSTKKFLLSRIEIDISITYYVSQDTYNTYRASGIV